MGESCSYTTYTITGWRWQPIEARLPFVAATFGVDVLALRRRWGWFRKTIEFQLYGIPSEIRLLIEHIEENKRWLRDL